MLRLFATLSLTLALAATAGAQQPLDGVAPVQPTRDEDCAEHRRQWSAQLQQLEAARTTCDRRDGGTVRTGGVWLPHCGTRQQAYVSCAPISDQLCAVRQQMDASVQACYRALAGHQRAQRDRETAAAGLEQKFDTLRRTMDQFNQGRQALDDLHGNGIAATVIDRALATPPSAAEQLQSQLREAARTAGTVAPDASPELNRAGRMLDEFNARAPIHEVARAFSSHSQGAARARMGDALNQFDGAARQAAADDLQPPPRPIPRPALAHSGNRATQAARPAPRPADDDEELDNEDLDDEERQARASRRHNHAVMRQALQGMQQIQRQLQQLQSRQRSGAGLR